MLCGETGSTAFFQFAGYGLPARNHTIRASFHPPKNSAEHAGAIVFGHLCLFELGNAGESCQPLCLPAAAFLFAIGRMLFIVGYRRGATGRSLGFALTFYPTVLLFVGLPFVC